MNPAFVALLLQHGAAGFQQECGIGLPFALTFLVAPAVLPAGTRSLLPRSKATSLPAWLQEHPDVRRRFGEVARSLTTVVREGLLFGVSKTALRLVDGRVTASSLPRGAPAAIRRQTVEFQEILDKANFVGRWYANAGTPETIMTLWGVRP